MQIHAFDLPKQKKMKSNKASRVDPMGALATRGSGPTNPKKHIGSRHGCPHLISHGDRFDRFTDQVLGQPLDVEDLTRVGSLQGVCPYYGSRQLLAEADLILAPYSAILSQETRNSLGLVLKDNVVIFDEAHNLVDAVNGAHSNNVGLNQLQGAIRWVRSKG